MGKRCGTVSSSPTRGQWTTHPRSRGSSRASHAVGRNARAVVAAIAKAVKVLGLVMGESEGSLAVVGWFGGRVGWVVRVALGEWEKHARVPPSPQCKEWWGCKDASPKKMRNHSGRSSNQRLAVGAEKAPDPAARPGSTIEWLVESDGK
jgi:hypothetical protein